MTLTWTRSVSLPRSSPEDSVILGIVLGALTYLLFGCQPPAVPEAVDACEPSLAALQAHDCPEGDRPTYVADCRHVAALGYVWPDDKAGPVCIVKASGIDALRACDVRCVGGR